MKRLGIDTSRWQGDFDFAKAMQEHGVEFAIIKAGGGDDGLYKDVHFDNSYNKCVRAGLPKGAYFFGKAMNMEDAKKEATYFLELLKGKQFEYPVFYDVEGAMLTLDKDTLTNICLYVLQTVQKAGYWVGIYTSESQFNNEVYDEKLKGFSHWVAKYSANEPKLTSGADVQMWQFGGETNLIRSKSINGQTVDQNYCYVDYPTLIKAKGLNGFGKTTQATTTAKPTTTSGASALKYKEGDVVSYDKIYSTSMSTTALKPDIPSGTITRVIEGRTNPYLINNGTGWVNDACIKGKVKKTTTTTASIKAGDKVKVINAINYDNGESFVLWHDVYDVLQVEGNRAVIGIGADTTSAIDIKNIKKV